MSKTPILLAASLALGLGACDRPAAVAPANNTQAWAGDDYLAKIAQLNPAQVQLTLFRAIRDAGQDCQDVTKVERLPDQSQRALWRVTCRGGGQWAVSIGREGIAQVSGPRTPR